MENLSLNNDAHNQQFLQVATRDDNDDSKIPTRHHVSDDKNGKKNHPSREDILVQEI